MRNTGTLLFIAACWSVLLMAGYFILDGKIQERNGEPVPSRERIINENGDLKYTKTFAICIMTEQCIPEHLLEGTAFGIPTDHDVYVLSYKRECKQIDTPSHVTYVFKPGTTWTTGRNSLYRFVKQKGTVYRYHIYMDDDVYLFYTDYLDAYSKKFKSSAANVLNQFKKRREYERAMREVRNGSSPLRVFEKILLKHSPAIAVVDSAQDRHQLIVKSNWKKACPPNTEMPLVTPTFFIDANFVAYHHEALPFLLPHSRVGDSISWRLSAVYLMQRAKTLFYRQCIGIWEVSALNAESRQYTKNPFPKNYLDIYWDTKEGRKIRDLIDHRERDKIVFYTDKEKLADVYLNDHGFCTPPIRFPISENYNVSMI